MVPKLHTERLILRPLEPRDDGSFWRLRTDPSVRQWLDGDTWPNIDRAREERLKLEAGMSQGKWYFWALSEKATRPLIGTVCLWNFNAERSDCELGFELATAWQGRGLMREATSTVMEWAWATLPLVTISALTHRENHRAKTLLGHHGFAPQPIPGAWEVTPEERATQEYYQCRRPAAPGL